MLPSRRTLLDILARAAALPGAAQFLAAWQATGDHQHNAAPAPPLLSGYTPQFFDAPDFAALQSFCEILIPTDDTPGAREAYCAHFIDFLLHNADAVPQLQRQWRSAMAALKEAGFHTSDAAGRAALVEAMSRPHPLNSVFRLVKQQNAFAFYTSRAGMIDALDYRGNTYNPTFPACNHPEHQTI